MTLATGRQAMEPLADINTTPLIDVLLVLLVMLIVTIPVATNIVPIDLPGESTDIPIQRTLNTVTITPDNRIQWNGSEVSDGQLARLLAETRKLPVEPELRFQPDASAAYGLSAQTLRTIKASGVTGFGFVGNEGYAHFDRADRRP